MNEPGLTIAQLHARLEATRAEWERIVTKAKYGDGLANSDDLLTEQELAFMHSRTALLDLIHRREDAERARCV